MGTIEVADAWSLLRMGVAAGFLCGVGIHLAIQAVRAFGWVDKPFQMRVKR